MSNSSPTSTDILSPVERRILLNVMAGRRGKEIAPIVGTSYDMVEKHIRNAREKLGGISRLDAARLVAADEGVGWVQILDVQKTDLSDPPSARSEVPDGLDAVADDAPPQSFPMPFPTKGRPTNELTFVQRWGWILALAVGAALLAVGLVATTGSLLDRLVRFFP